ncbi:MAG TPA: SLC13 family permease, partial [Candidatus Competibacter phosphatis]|nr:SLC13 family permease [Candidatus Competibacter phosphatis]
MQTIEMTISAQRSPDIGAGRQKPLTAFWSQTAGVVTAMLFAAGVWYGIPQLDAPARSALIVFGITLGAWVFSRLEETVVALAALLTLALSGVIESTAMLDSLGHSLIGLMLASFIIAAAANATGLSQWLAATVVRRARSVEQLCYWLTAANLVTALFIPATSARAALMAPVFLALNQRLNEPRVGKVLALVFPTAILLSAAASLTGAGAHLLTADLVAQLGDERLDFLRWLTLGLPFALVSSFGSTWVILRLFLTQSERRQALTLESGWVKGSETVTPEVSRSKQYYVLGVILTMIGLWATTNLHGLDNSLVSVLGALAVTWPGLGPISLKKGLKTVEWGLLLFMAAALELGESLVRTGAAEWLVSHLFIKLQAWLSGSALLLAGGVAVIGLLSHLVITSRSARAAILIPAVILLALSLDYNPAALAFSAAIASGYCLTFTV